MKSILYLFCLVFLLISCQSESKILTPPPSDTIIKYDMEDGSTKDLKRNWLKTIHQAEESVDWQSIEHQNMMDKYKRKEDLTKSGDKEIIVPGVVEGEWRERGSSNQAGNVLVTTYNKYLDELYTVSASGIIWKGSSTGENWTPQNESLRFDNRFLASFFSDTTDRIVSSIRGLPYYSDDKGLTWTASTGVPSESYIPISKWVRSPESNKLFILTKEDNWSDLNLYLSIDFGESFTLLNSYSGTSAQNFAFCNPRNSDEVYFIEQIHSSRSKIHKWIDSLNNTMVINDSSPMAFGSNGRANLIGVATDSLPLLYSYDGSDRFSITKNEGLTWDTISTLPTTPWEVGVFVSSSNPLNMIYGEVNSYRSLDGGASWHLINVWSDYYNDPIKKLHADIMYIEEYETIDSSSFILISNHGGINRTDDGSFSNYNISADGLNVAQYYDVVSFPFDHEFVFAGSQDQGFQRGPIMNDGEEAFPLEQVISGDYGHITFTRGGLDMWMVYPGGWVSYYDSPLTGNIRADWTLDSDDESVWIPPIAPVDIDGLIGVYMAGGNIDGGKGSYLIRLLYDPIEGLVPFQYDYNFKDNGDIIAAIGINHFDASKIYVAGRNGAFYVSNNFGFNFERRQISLPGAHYLYGNCIYPSRVDPNTIYVSGSGYSNAPVLRSIDGGLTFEPMSDGLPSTLVFNVVANEDESLLFAASEAGPYVFVTEENKWYDLSGLSAPANTYWSVEYLSPEGIARFGTYGRGIWDFIVDEQIVSNVISEKKETTVSLYPNPTDQYLNIKSNGEYELLGVYNLSGQKMSVSLVNKKTFDVSGLTAGIYFVGIKTNEGNKSIQFVKQ